MLSILSRNCQLPGSTASQFAAGCPARHLCFSVHLEATLLVEKAGQQPTPNMHGWHPQPQVHIFSIAPSHTCHIIRCAIKHHYATSTDVKKYLLTASCACCPRRSHAAAAADSVGAVSGTQAAAAPV